MFCRELNRGKCKTYLLACERTRHAVLIDPLKENTGRYIAVAAYHGFRLDYLIDTHTHADHRSGTFDLADLTDAKVVMERHAPAPHVAVHVTDGDVIEVGDLRIKIFYTPGHTPDGMSLSVDGRVFTGDTLMIGGTGRADFPGGDAGKQYDGIISSLFTLPDDTVVLPAHDYRGNHSSTIGIEKASNPRVAGRTRERIHRHHEESRTGAARQDSGSAAGQSIGDRRRFSEIPRPEPVERNPANLGDRTGLAGQGRQRTSH